ncbi:MAG: adenine phosphoribosyltransferase [Elusimicrobia bacterium]|nr:adenine phosphoribosyltransferase [Elusimicrobiota bacterium]MDE2313024.1 adenine phosphoribosyltransferase [Elusimicrobiota bacterium]
MKPPARDLRSLIKDVPDFPKKGIVFKDITPLLADAQAFTDAIDRMAAPFADRGIALVAGIESRGFLLAGPVAQRLKAGVTLIRKKGKLPRKTVGVAYSLEYGQDSLEAHADAVPAGAKVLVVDDVLATGGTAAAACRLVEKLGGSVEGLSFLMELGFLRGRDKLDGREIQALLSY